MNSAAAKEMQEWRKRRQETGKREAKSIGEMREDQTQIEDIADNDDLVVVL